MPVQLDAVPAAAPMPPPIRPVVWLLLLGCTIGAGAVATLLAWPKDTPASGNWFWSCLLVFPTLAWAFLLGLRLYVHDGKSNYARDRNRRREDRLMTETLRGQRPIAVLAGVYETAMGDADLGVKLVNGGEGLQVVYPPDDGDPVRCSMLPESVRGLCGEAASLTSLFRRVLKRMTPWLRAMPSNVPIHVRLQVNAGGDAAFVEQAWREAADDYLPIIASPRMVEAEAGLLILDQWLDMQETGRSGSVFLIVALQLHVTPLDQTGEAVAAVLLARGMRPHDGTPVANLHRPVAFAQADVDARCADALLWGRHAAGQVGGLWTGGLDASSLNAVTAAADRAGAGSANAERLVHFDLDMALGHTGIAAGWLAAAAAIERCQKEKQPQLVAISENGHHRALVVAPANT